MNSQQAQEGLNTSEQTRGACEQTRRACEQTRKVCGRSIQPGQSSTRFAVIVTAAFALVAGAVLTRHEMWRDELQAWMLARDATGLFSLWHNLRYEGHPGLWHLLLFSVSRFTRSPASMQVLHLALATAAVFVFLRCARVPRLHKVLYTFGFFPLYQYAVVSRCYALGILLVMVYCALASAGRHTGRLGAAVLALLANASAYGWLLAFSLGAVLLVPEAFRAPRTWRRLAPTAILLCGLAVSIVGMYPPADQDFGGIRQGLLSGNVPWSGDKVSQALADVSATYLSAVIPLPPGLGVTLTLAFAALFALAFARQRTALAVYLLSLISMVVFKYVIYMGGPWHNGHFLIALIACWWLYACRPPRALRPRPLDAISRACRWLLPGVMAAFLALHVLVAGFSVVQEWREPYSGGKAVAQFIANSDLRDLPILGDADSAVTSVCGYLGKPVYYLTSESWGTFVIWSTKRRDIAGDQTELQRRVQRAPVHGTRSVLVVNYELTPGTVAALGARAVFATPPAIFADEQFWVYYLP